MKTAMDKPDQASENKPTNSTKPKQLTSQKFTFYIICTYVTFFTLFQIQYLHNPPLKPSSPPSSWSFMHQWQKLLHTNPPTYTTTEQHQSSTQKLRHSITFLPLKDNRFADKPLVGHTWFMSSMYDTQKAAGEVQHQQFPSESSNGRLLCLKGRDTHDGAWNYYALAYPEALPLNATLMRGLTFVSYNHYDYQNIWHGLMATLPFVAWHIRNECALPTRWVLYHWGELRFNMGSWLRTLMESTFGEDPNIERFDDDDDDDDGDRDYNAVVCFEKAVVMRHNEGGMSRERRTEVYDLIRCKARSFCNVSNEIKRSKPFIGMTLFLRTGPRSFRNNSMVINIFEKECRKVKGCELMVAYSNNLTVCDQVKLMSMTDILVTPHGAQLTNMFLMDRNSSVMEFFPKGWLKLAGVGQFVYNSMASWSGMNHKGVWRDPDGEHCPFPEDDRRCMPIYKSGMVGYNETYFAEWARKVINEVRARKLEDASNVDSNNVNGCECS